MQRLVQGLNWLMVADSVGVCQRLADSTNHGPLKLCLWDKRHISCRTTMSCTYCHRHNTRFVIPQRQIVFHHEDWECALSFLLGMASLVLPLRVEESVCRGLGLSSLPVQINEQSQCIICMLFLCRV